MIKNGIEKENLLPLKGWKPHSKEELLSEKDFSKENLIKKTTAHNTNKSKKQINK